MPILENGTATLCRPDSSKQTFITILCDVGCCMITPKDADKINFLAQGTPALLAEIGSRSLQQCYISGYDVNPGTGEYYKKWGIQRQDRIIVTGDDTAPEKTGTYLVVADCEPDSGLGLSVFTPWVVRLP